MKRVHEIKVSVFAKPEEDIERITLALKELIPLDIEKEKLLLVDTVAKSFSDRAIHILEVSMEKERHTKKFLSFLNEKLDTLQKKTLTEQAESRLDAELFFYIRLDKDDWLYDRKITLTDEGHCYHIRMHLAAFPAKRDNGLAVVKQLFGP